MSDDMPNLRTFVEKSPNADLLREMIGFAGQRLIELEIHGQSEAAHGESSAQRLAQRNGCRTGSGKPASAPSNFAFPTCAKGPTSPASWSRAAWPRRRSPPQCRNPMCKAS